MFFQICLLTVGLRLGRLLLDGLRETEPDEGDRQAPDDATSGRDAAHREAAGAASASLDEAQVDAQLQLALATGATTLVTACVAPRLSYLGGVGVLYGSLPIFQRAGQQMFFEGRVGSDLLHSIGILVSLAARQFTSLTALFLLDAGAQKLLHKTEVAAQRSVAAALSGKTQEAWILRGGAEVSAAIDSIQAGEILVVTAGNSIPLDGLVVRGSAQVAHRDPRSERTHFSIGVGDHISEGMLVTAGRVEVRVQHPGRQATAAEQARIQQSTQSLARTIDGDQQHVADAAAVSLLALSGLSSKLIGIEAMQALLSADLIDNLRWGQPLGLHAHLLAAYERGLVFRDSAALQRLSSVDTVVLGKTDSLTLDQLRVCRVHGLAGRSEADVLSLAAAAEYRQGHPFAGAIRAAAQAQGLQVPQPDHAHYHVGAGVHATLAGRAVHVGSRRFLQSCGVMLPPSVVAIETTLREQGHAAVYIAADQTLVGLIEIEAPLRPEVATLCALLRERKRTVLLISGEEDAQTPTARSGAETPQRIAAASAADKVSAIQALQQQGHRVCYVGSSLGDAVASQHAWVSVSFDDAAPAARRAAQIVLGAGGLLRIPSLFALADHFQRTTERIQLAVNIPAVLALCGVFGAGFTANSVVALHVASLAVSGLLATQASSGLEKVNAINGPEQ